MPTLLAAPFPDHVQNEREQHAQQDGGCKREVEGGVLASINDVPGEAAQRQVQAADKKEDDSAQDQRTAEKNQELAKIGHDTNHASTSVQDLSSFYWFSAARNARPSMTCTMNAMYC